jgi:wyosine [tRNA(Phe)-imidazoG37] synthetase (radical SAM superfamily)
MKKYIPIRDLHTENKYNLYSLLNDNSVDLNLLKKLDIDLSSEQEFSKLLHPEVRYEVTDHCNATCIMCPREEHENGRPHGIMSTEQYKKSIDEVVKLGAKKIVLTGFGEPMLDKGLEEKISYAKTKNLSTYIISNGSVLNSKRALSILEAGLDEIRISFYGMGSDTYNKVMQGLDYEKTKKGLLSFIEKRDKNNFKCKIQLSYLTLPENEKDQDNFQKFWEPLVDYIEIWKPHNFGDGRSYRHREDNLKSSCGRPSTGPLQIQWNGEVIPCCYDYNNKIVLGNAFQDPVLEILNGDKYKLLRFAHNSKKFNLFPYCDQCDQLLPHADALIYTNRHNLPAEEAVKLSNTDLYNLVDAKEFDENLT